MNAASSWLGVGSCLAGKGRASGPGLAVALMPDAIQVRINSVSPEPIRGADDWVPASKAQAIVELAPEGGCLRGAQFGDLFAASLRADGGALRGTLIGPRTSHALTCHESTDPFEP